MSAPETKALPPAPLSTTTRTDRRRRSGRRRSARPPPTCLSRRRCALAGLLKIIQPIAPFFRRLAACHCSWSMLLWPGGSDDVALLEGGDLGLATGRSPPAPRRCARRAPAARPRTVLRRALTASTGWPTRSMSPTALRVHCLRHAEVLDLRVGEDLVDPVDRARTARPPRSGARSSRRCPAARDRRRSRRSARRGSASGRRGLGSAGRSSQSARRPRWQKRSQIAPPAAAMLMWPSRGLEHAGRDAGRVVVAGLLRHLAFDQPARGLEVEHEDLRLQQRGLHPLALARALALEQRDQDALGGRRGRRTGRRSGCRRAPGPGPAAPVIDISPPMPCAIWSKPGRSRRGRPGRSRRCWRRRGAG